MQLFRRSSDRDERKPTRGMAVWIKRWALPLVRGV